MDKVINKGRCLKYLGFLIFLVFLGFSAITINASEKKEASIKFETTVYDFGNVNEKGGPVTHEFKYTNEGTAPLIIKSARAECGCTKPSFTEAPVKPGESGIIKVTYNPLGRPGGFTKIVTVRCNGVPGKVNLKIRGTVNPQK